MSEGRKYLIRALLEIVSNLVGCYRLEKPVCVNALVYGPNKIELGKECDTIVYGSLIRGLETIGIVPSFITSSDIRMSASELMRQLRLIRCYSLREPIVNAGTFHHSKCVFTEKLKQDIDRINKDVVPLAINVAVDDSFRKHMKEQAEK